MRHALRTFAVESIEIISGDFWVVVETNYPRKLKTKINFKQALISMRGFICKTSQVNEHSAIQRSLVHI